MLTVAVALGCALQSANAFAPSPTRMSYSHGVFASCATSSARLRPYKGADGLRRCPHANGALRMASDWGDEDVGDGGGRRRPEGSKEICMALEMSFRKVLPSPGGKQSRDSQA